MSLSAGEAKIGDLRADNFDTWIEKVKDYIFALDHDDAVGIWTAYMWQAPEPGAVVEEEDEGDEPAGDPAEHDYQAANNAGTKKLRLLHNKTFAFIRRNLGDNMFEVSRSAARHNSVPKLLRALRDSVNDGGVIDRSTLRKQFNTIKLEDYDNMELYIAGFNNLVTKMKYRKMSSVDDDEDVLFRFNEGIPTAYAQVKLVIAANNKSLLQAQQFYLAQAKLDVTLPGTMSNITRKTDAVNATGEICRLFTQGKCRFGDRCKFDHPGTTPKDGQGTGDKSRITCFYCGKQGHVKNECRKKIADDAAKAKGGDATHNTQESQSKATQDAAATQQGQQQDEELKFDEASYCTGEVEEVTLNVSAAQRSTLRKLNQGKQASKQGKASTAARGDDLYMVLDGASTVGVVEDELLCENVRPANITLKVGGQGKPNFVQCKKVGELRAHQLVDGRATEFTITVRIVPGFGCSILPECYFLKRGFDINKHYKQAKVVAPNGKTALLGNALSHDSSWLFYLKLQLGKPPRDAVIDNYKGEVTFALRETVSEVERRTTLANVQDEKLEKCYKITSRMAAEAGLLLWHKRLAHRNFKDVADMLGITLPTKLPSCVACIKGKSKRHALTGSDAPVHEAVRPGYAYGWDHEGPFRTKTWGGNNYLSLKMCLYSGKINANMTNSTSTSGAEWSEHVLHEKAKNGEQRIAFLYTDSAPYFGEKRMQAFNTQHGINHVMVPAYTQELNGKVERTIGTVLAMTRTALDEAQVPEKAYGEALLHNCYVLDR